MPAAAADTRGAVTSSTDVNDVRAARPPSVPGAQYLTVEDMKQAVSIESLAPDDDVCSATEPGV